MAEIYPKESPGSGSTHASDGASSDVAGLAGSSEASAAFSSAPPQELESDRMLRVVRAGAVMMLAFQFTYLEWDVLVRNIWSAEVIACHLGTLLVGCIALALTLVGGRWPTRQWRALAFWSGAAVIAAMTRIAQLTGESTPLLMAGLVMIVGSGSTLPWERRWQAAFNLLPLVGLLFVGTHSQGGIGGFGWFAIVAAALFSQTTNRSLMQSREVLQRYRVELRSSDQRLREETARRKSVARDLAESAAMLRAVFDSTSDLITVVRLSDDRLIEVNQAIEQFGLTHAAAMGSTMLESGVWPDLAVRTEFLAEIEREGIVRNREVVVRRPDGAPVSMLVSAALAELGGEQCVLAIWREIGTLKASERELIAAREAALAASRAKSDFLAGMSHEIRTPLNAIIGMSELLADTQLNTQQRQYLTVMQANGNSLMALINNILDLARVESGRLNLEQVPFNLETLTDTVGETLALSAHAKGLELVINLEPNVVRNLIGDPLRLKQVLINLVGNAIKFTERGEVVVTVEQGPAGDGWVELRFSVTDTGIGIAATEIPKLFSSFTQANSSVARTHGGSGLGLSIVRQLVEMMDGRAWVESRFGAGSTFYFTARLRVNPSAIAAAEPADSATATGAARLAGLRTLVVDDNRVNRMVVHQIIAATGAEVDEADSGATALEKLKSGRRSGHPYDLMILDCRMPDMDGFRVVQHLRADPEHDDMIVLMLSSEDLNLQIPRARELGLDAYIVKPVRRTELLAAIARAVAAHGRVNLPETGPTPPTVNNGGPAAPANHPETAPDPIARMLLADDSADNRLLISSYLKRMSYRIDEAESGDEAFRKATSAHYDLILMDLQMPKVDGLTATQMIRAWEQANGRPRTPIVMLTASVLEEDVRRARAAGADAHLSKPVTRSMLLQTISEIGMDDAEPAERDDAAPPAR